MYVRCTHCGYDNSPEYRFCGMCGASLAHPPVATKTVTKDAVPEKENGHNGSNGNPETVHGPSFLGLAEDPKTEFHYLYEDEQPRSHVGAIFVVILLLAAGGFGYWQWRHNGFPFNRLGGSSASTQSASPSEVAPAQSQDQQTHIDHPMTGVGDVLPTAPDQNNQNKPSDNTKTPDQSAQGESQNAQNNKSQADNAAQNQEAASTEKTQEKPQEEAKATPPPSVPERHARKPKTPAPKAAAPKAEAAPATPAAKASPDADLELAGEKYLYGTGGIRQNCARAESSLRTAATHGNSKAQTVLGTMYATGHCVGRDLPTAYRWFARALHQEPQNTRISADLQVLWRQMSAQERQLATSAER
jgi:outer membrane biosynthesis protein TonB